MNYKIVKIKTCNGLGASPSGYVNYDVWWHSRKLPNCNCEWVVKTG